MSKTKLIDSIRDILVPDRRPRSLVFWPAGNGRYLHNGVPLTREQCEQIPCRFHIFINRKTHEQKRTD
jgi:hypothetical protein